MRIGWRSGPKYGILLTLKPTSLFVILSIKKKCVQIVGKVLGIYKDSVEIIKLPGKF